MCLATRECIHSEVRGPWLPRCAKAVAHAGNIGQGLGGEAVRIKSAEQCLFRVSPESRFASGRMEMLRIGGSGCLGGTPPVLRKSAQKFAVLPEQFPYRSGQGSVFLAHIPVFIAQFSQVLAQFLVVPPQAFQFVNQGESAWKGTGGVLAAWNSGVGWFRVGTEQQPMGLNTKKCAQLSRNFGVRLGFPPLVSSKCVFMDSQPVGEFRLCECATYGSESLCHRGVGVQSGPRIFSYVTDGRPEVVRH